MANQRRLACARGAAHRLTGEAWGSRPDWECCEGQLGLGGMPFSPVTFGECDKIQVASGLDCRNEAPPSVALCPRMGPLPRCGCAVERAWVQVAREAVGPVGWVVAQQDRTTAPQVHADDRRDLVVAEAGGR